MFRQAYQKGFLSIFSSCGSSPLKIWDVNVKDGCVELVVDEELKSLVLEITGCNVSTTYISCPRDKDENLAIKMPVCTLNWKNTKEYFSFEIMVKDDKSMRRRFCFSNFLNLSTRHKPTFFAICPIKNLPEGWKELKFNLSDLTKKAFSSRYVETVRVQINANCRLKGIYFSDKLYDEEDIPNNYKLVKTIQARKKYIPQRNSSTKKKSIQSKVPTICNLSEDMHWIKNLNGEEHEYSIPPPSEATYDEDECSTYNVESKNVSIEHEKEGSDEESERSNVAGLYEYEMEAEGNTENENLEENYFDNQQEVFG